MTRLTSLLAILFISIPMWAAPQPTLSFSLQHKARSSSLLSDLTSKRPQFYSKQGTELKVRFTAIYRTYRDLATINALTEYEKASIVRYEMGETMDFLFGPLTHTQLGSPQRSFQIQARWEQARAFDGGTEIPIDYENSWIVNNILLNQSEIELPLPYNSEVVYSAQWKKCTDSQPDHQTRSYYWYYWDPNRRSCDHKLGEHYQMIKVQILGRTQQQQNSMPEYNRMLRIKNGRPTFAMTFAFGYVEDENQKDPFKDRDVGVQEFQDFVRYLQMYLQGYEETPILLSSYIGYETWGDQKMGARFFKAGPEFDIEIKAVVNFKIDQMELFAKSYAEEHDGLFAWFGHSRVGSGFDAQNFQGMLRRYPDRLSITPDYQVIYWGGCNSYSYYTLPFFNLKATPQDPLGTKGLDIIANGLPSYFILNSINAKVALQAFLNGRGRTTYQEIIDRIESYGRSYGISVLAVVLGDEDNTTTIERN